MEETGTATKQIVEQIFDGAASSYGRTGPDLFSIFGARLIEWLDLPTGARVLDVGVGTGAVALAAAGRVGAGGAVVGIDISQEMLAQAEQAVRVAHLNNVALHKMDAEAMGFQSESFDAITCGFSLFFLSSMEKGLAEMHRVCKPGGTLGLSMWGKTPPPFDPAWRWLSELVRKYGVEMRMPQRIAYAPEDLETLLGAAGWSGVRVNAETSELRYTEEEWWAFQFTLGTRAALLRLSPDDLARLKDEYLGRLRPLFRGGNLFLPAPVLYAAANKPRRTREGTQESL